MRSVFTFIFKLSREWTDAYEVRYHRHARDIRASRATRRRAAMMLSCRRRVAHHRYSACQRSSCQRSSCIAPSRRKSLHAVVLARASSLARARPFADDDPRSRDDPLKPTHPAAAPRARRGAAVAACPGPSAAAVDGAPSPRRREGHGTLTSAAATYVGAFRAHTFHGHGVKTFADGTKLQGDWKDGEPNFHAPGSADASPKPPPADSEFPAEALEVMHQIRDAEQHKAKRAKKPRADL
jgi:hypothetical protein